MSVGNLSWIAFGFARNRFNSQLIDLLTGFRGDDDPESQFGKEGVPEWVILVHIQYTRNANGSTRSTVFLQWTVFEDTVQFILIEVWHVVLFLFFSSATFTAVTGDKTAVT